MRMISPWWSYNIPGYLRTNIVIPVPWIQYPDLRLLCKSFTLRSGHQSHDNIWYPWNLQWKHISLPVILVIKASLARSYCAWPYQPTEAVCYNQKNPISQWPLSAVQCAVARTCSTEIEPRALHTGSPPHLWLTLSTLQGINALETE